MSTHTTQGIKSISLEAKIIRADGTQEDLGKVAEYKADPKQRSGLLSAIHVVNPNLYQRYLRS